jgi:phosphoribosyl 1,2-cyclic phosphodiesterase
VKICILASGSSGNSFLVWTDRTKILIDAGISARQLRERLKGLGIPAEQIEALFITHEHTDHVRGAGTLARSLRIPVFMTEGTCAACNSTFEQLPAREFFTPGDIVCFKDLQLVSYSVSHDAADPVNFLLCHKNRKVGMAMDLGYTSRLVKERLKHCDVLILETNVDERTVPVAGQTANSESPRPPLERSVGIHALRSRRPRLTRTLPGASQPGKQPSAACSVLVPTSTGRGRVNPRAAVRDKPKRADSGF